jgi:ubiquinol-cytochrome c reductase cytochrome b subunit
LLPFLIVGLVIVHLTLLHIDGSTNNLGIPTTLDRAPFYPYFYLKDLVGFFGFLLIFFYFVFFVPNLLGHPDNYIRANALITPTHIVPE